MLATIAIALLLQTAAPAAPSGAQASQIGLQELTQRRDLWPARVSLRKGFNFGGGDSVRAGQELGLQEVRGATLVLDTGRFVFDCPAGDTDVLERARALAAALTPEQLALTLATLRERSELWPLEVALRSTVELMDGTRIDGGQALVLRGFEGGEVSVLHRPSGIFFMIDPNDSDLIARSRERLKLPPEVREPFFVRSLEQAMEPRPEAAEATAPAYAKALPGVDYILIFSGRQGCSRCAAFAPELKRFYEKNKPAHPGFEVVFASQDASVEAARAVAAEHGLPGRMIAPTRTLEAAQIANIPNRLLPGVYLFDRAGKMLERNDPEGGSPNGRDVLASLEQRLKQPAPSAR